MYFNTLHGLILLRSLRLNPSRRLNAILEYEIKPNPVMKTDEGCLLYADPGSRSILHTWKIWIGDKMPEALIDHANTPSDAQIELAVAQIYAFHVVLFRKVNVIFMQRMSLP